MKNREMLENRLEELAKEKTYLAKFFQNARNKGVANEKIDEWNTVLRKEFNVKTNLNQLKMKEMNQR